MSEELTSGLAQLVASARNFMAQTYQTSSIQVGGVVDNSLGWQPSLHFKVNNHLLVICEASETPYPMILKMRRQDIMGLNKPIAVYCVCPEAAYVEDQSEAKSLMNHGYGLLTVDAQGTVQRRASCIPLIQQISQTEFVAEVRELPPKFRTRLAEAFERYKSNAPSGAADITEVMEGLIIKAAKEAASKNWITVGQSKALLSPLLSTMQGTPQFQGASAAIGAAQAYVSMYRNVSHHFPKTGAQAAKKYRDCRHSFLEGLRKVAFVRTAFKNIGLSGGI